MAPGVRNEIEITADEISERLSLLGSFNAESIRALRREYSRRLSKSPPRFVVEVAFRVLSKGTSGHRFLSYELVNKHKNALSSLNEMDLKRFGKGIGSWDSVDMFGCFLSGPAWREHQVSDKLIHSWAHSKNRWFRRAALVSTVPLNNKARGGSGDPRRTVEVCRILVKDRDDMVIKAMSWALRELAKRDPERVRLFLGSHKDDLASRVVREVTNKLSTGLKNPRVKRAIEPSQDF